MKEEKRSIPVNFSLMTAKELQRAFDVIKLMVESAKTEDGGRILFGKTENITFPLRCLAEVTRVDYIASIELAKINKALSEIGVKVSALTNFEKLFFAEKETTLTLVEPKGARVHP